MFSVDSMLQSLTVVLAMLVQVFCNSSALVYLVQTFCRNLCCALSYAVPYLMLCSCALGRRCVHCCSFFPSADPRCDNRIGSRALAVLSRSELFSIFLLIMNIVATHPSTFVVVILCREGAGSYHCRGTTAGTARLCESIVPASSKCMCLTVCADSAALRSYRRQHAIGLPSQRAYLC